MQYLLSLSDQLRQHMVVFTLRELDVKRNAIDFFFEVIGADPDQLGSDGVIPQGQVDDLRTIQALMFGQDKDGCFIRDEVNVFANGNPLDPDQSMTAAFVSAERDGVKYMRCEGIVSLLPGADLSKDRIAPGAVPASKQPLAVDNEDEESLNSYARMFFMDQIANGYQIDVTKELPEFSESIAEAEKHAWIEIDVQKAAYRLTPEGTKMQQAWIAEAQDLIKRYDIYGDVDIASDGTVRFDTKLGRDLRISVMEFDGVDPFRARFLIGLNDGEWNNISDWPQLYRNQGWYETLMRDVEYAPSVDDVGRDKLSRVLDAGKEQLRQDSRLR